MHQIIKTEIKANSKIYYNCISLFDEDIEKILNEKGGEAYSFTAINTSTNEVITEYCFDETEFFDSWERFDEKVMKKIDTWNHNNKICFVFYSKQLSELDEFGNEKPDPCLENNRYVWFSGSITNLDEIEKALGKKFTAPSQAVAYYDDLLQKDIIIKGVYIALIYDLKENYTYWIYNGMPIWEITYKFNNINSIVQNLYTEVSIKWEGTTENINTLILNDNGITSNVNIKPSDVFPYYYEHLKEKNAGGLAYYYHNHHYYVLFSGGIDSIMSSYVNISRYVFEVKGNTNIIKSLTIPPNSNKRKYIFIYFDYGSKASKQEIVAMKKYYELVKEEFPNMNFEYRIIDVKNFFKDDFYKNSKFTILLGKIIDEDLEKELFIPHVILSSNLSKTSFHPDNTFVWAQGIKYVLSYGGNNYKFIYIDTPFINVSKSNIIKSVISTYGYEKTKELLDIAYSCVDPDKNGKPCGKCENCLLREKAFKNAIKYIKKSFFKNKLKGE